MPIPDQLYASGDPWKPNAAQFNFWTQGARAAQGISSGSAGIPAISSSQPLTAIRVRNNSEEKLPHLACVVIGPPTILPDDSEGRFRYTLTMNCDIPAGDDGENSTYGILLSELAPNAVGDALITGVTPVRITGDREGTAVEPMTDDTVMQVGSGWPIIWQEPDSDTERWAVIAVSLADAPTAVAWGEVTHITSGTVTGFALVRIDYCTSARYVGQSVWVGDYMGQLLADEASVDRIGRRVQIGRVAKPLITFHTYTDSATSTTRGPKWLLMAANCPEVV